MGIKTRKNRHYICFIYLAFRFPFLQVQLAVYMRLLIVLHVRQLRGLRRRFLLGHAMKNYLIFADICHLPAVVHP